MGSSDVGRPIGAWGSRFLRPKMLKPTRATPNELILYDSGRLVNPFG